MKKIMPMNANDQPAKQINGFKKWYSEDLKSEVEAAIRKIYPNMKIIFLEKEEDDKMGQN